MIMQSHPSATDAWLIVAAPTSVLALPAIDAGRVLELTAQLCSADGFRGVLESLVGDGIASAPSFALLDGDAAVLRVVLRGDAAVTALVAGAEVTFSGTGMATWTERVLEGASSLQLTVPGSSWTVVLDTGAAPAVAAASIPAVVAENTLVPHGEAEVAPASSAPPARATEEPKADPDSEAYDFLFGDTIYRTQAGASIRIPNPDPQRPGDHDGHTMLVATMAEISEATVLALIPPHASGVAAADIPPTLPIAPALQLERRDGSRESLSRPLLIGRSPAASGAGPEPRLLTVADDPDISRTHLRVAVEGDAVVVTDLGSKNGTIITLPGVAPRKLRASELTVVLPGTLIDLGGGTTFTVCED